MSRTPAKATAPIIVLWDIDNTLLYTGGAGTVGMTRAFHALYGVDDAFGGVEFSGRSDRAIFRDAALAHSVATAEGDTELTRFIDAYVPELEAALHEVTGSLMPGVRSLLDGLAGREGVVQGLGTGNFRATAVAKLTHYGIAHYFPGFVGGFGDDHELREGLIRMGIERLSGGQTPARVVIIGDTPHDIAAARANGAFSLGVATGRDSTEILRAAGADAVRENLEDTARALELVLGL